MARAKQRGNEIAAGLRPIAKALIKEALRLYDAAKETLDAAGEKFEDVVAEARAEMKQGKPSKSGKKHKGNP